MSAPRHQKMPARRDDRTTRSHPGARTIADHPAIPHDDSRPRQTARTGAVIGDDRLCPRCKYNIRGLPIGGVCPECGTSIIATPGGKSATKELPIDQAPKSYIRLLFLAFTLLACGGFGGAIMVLLIAFNAIDPDTGLMTIVALNIAWTAGAILIVRPRPTATPRKPGETEWKWLRRTVVASAIAGTLASGIAFTLAHLNSELAILLIIPIQVFGIIALCSTAIYGSFLCDWASDTTMADRLRTMVWLLIASWSGLVLSQIFIDLGPDFLTGFAWIAAVLCSLVYLVAAATINITWLQAIGMIAWVQRNAKAALEREIRRAERRRKEDERRLRHAMGTPDPDGLDPPARQRFDARQRDQSQPPPTQPGRSTHRITPGDSINPYEVED